MILSVNLQAEDCNFSKSNTSLWVFFTFLRLYKCYRSVQSITNNSSEYFYKPYSKYLLKSFIYEDLTTKLKIKIFLEALKILSTAYKSCIFEVPPS